jgi:hypothetical protein
LLEGKTCLVFPNKSTHKHQPIGRCLWVLFFL